MKRIKKNLIDTFKCHSEEEYCDGDCKYCEYRITKALDEFELDVRRDAMWEVFKELTKNHPNTVGANALRDTIREIVERKEQ